MATLVSIDKYLKNNPVPDWNSKVPYEQNIKAEEQWIARLKEDLCKADLHVRVLPEGCYTGYVGEVVGWPVADGTATYIIVKEKPLRLAHLPLGDGYCVPAAMIRGLRLADVIAIVNAERRWDALIASKKKE